MDEVIKEIIDTTGKRKVEIFKRNDGSFGFESWQFSDEPLENCWIPYGYGRSSACFAADQEIAEREARGRVDWLRDCSEDDQ